MTLSIIEVLLLINLTNKHRKKYNSSVKKEKKTIVMSHLHTYTKKYFYNT